MQYTYSITFFSFRCLSVGILPSTYCFCDRFFSVAELFFDRYLFMWHNLVSATETYLCDRNYFRWQNLNVVTWFFFYQRILFPLTETLFLTKYMTDTYFCFRNLFLWQKPISLTKTSFSDKNSSLYGTILCLSQKHISVTKTFFYNNLFLWHNLVSVWDTFFCDRKIFLWQKPIFVTKTNFCNRNLFCRNPFFFYAWIQGKSFREKWEFLGYCR